MTQDLNDVKASETCKERDYRQRYEEKLVKSKQISQRIEQKQKAEELGEERGRYETRREEERPLPIPQIPIKPLSVKLSVELDTSINIAKAEEDLLKVPQIAIPKPNMSLIKNLDTTVSIKREAYGKLIIPQVRLGIFKLSSNIELDTEVRIVREESPIKVPQLLLRRFKPIQPYEKFLIDTPIQIQHAKLDTDVTTQEATETKEALSESGELELEDLEPFDSIFHMKGGTIDFDEPLVICLEEPENDSYIGTIRTLCKLIYREKVGGHPEPIIIESLEEFKDELRWIKAEHRIFSVKLSKKEWSELTDDDWIRIWSRIKQLFSQGFGVIILNTNITPIGEHIINVVKLKPKELPPRIRKEIVELFWGVRVSDDDALKPFDLPFETARRKKDQLLKRLEKLEGGIYWDATKEDENESKLHRQIKAFIVRLLVKDLREGGFKLRTPTEIERYVKTEFEIGDVRADVFIDEKVYEIETLFAEDRGGKTVRDQLRETFKKYENTSIKEINIILDNPTFIRHIGTILSLLRNYRDWMKEKQKVVNFYTIDIENERLVSLKEIANKLEDLKQKIKNVQRLC